MLRRLAPRKTSVDKWKSSTLLNETVKPSATEKEKVFEKLSANGEDYSREKAADQESTGNHFFRTLTSELEINQPGIPKTPDVSCFFSEDSVCSEYAPNLQEENLPPVLLNSNTQPETDFEFQVDTSTSEILSDQSNMNITFEPIEDIAEDRPKLNGEEIVQVQIMESTSRSTAPSNINLSENSDVTPFTSNWKEITCDVDCEDTSQKEHCAHSNAITPETVFDISPELGKSKQHCIDKQAEYSGKLVHLKNHIEVASVLESILVEVSNNTDSNATLNSATSQEIFDVVELLQVPIEITVDVLPEIEDQSDTETFTPEEATPSVSVFDEVQCSLSISMDTTLKTVNSKVLINTEFLQENSLTINVIDSCYHENIQNHVLSSINNNLEIVEISNNILSKASSYSELVVDDIVITVVPDMLCHVTFQALPPIISRKVDENRIGDENVLLNNLNNVTMRSGRSQTQHSKIFINKDVHHFLQDQINFLERQEQTNDAEDSISVTSSFSTSNTNDNDLQSCVPLSIEETWDIEVGLNHFLNWLHGLSENSSDAGPTEDFPQNTISLDFNIEHELIASELPERKEATGDSEGDNKKATKTFENSKSLAKCGMSNSMDVLEPRSFKEKIQDRRSQTCEHSSENQGLEEVKLERSEQDPNSMACLLEISTADNFENAENQLEYDQQLVVFNLDNIQEACGQTNNIGSTETSSKSTEQSEDIDKLDHHFEDACERKYCETDTMLKENPDSTRYAV